MNIPIELTEKGPERTFDKIGERSELSDDFVVSTAQVAGNTVDILDMELEIVRLSKLINHGFVTKNNIIWDFRNWIMSYNYSNLKKLFNLINTKQGFEFMMGLLPYIFLSRSNDNYLEIFGVLISNNYHYLLDFPVEILLIMNDLRIRISDETINLNFTSLYSYNNLVRKLKKIWIYGLSELSYWIS